MDALLLPAAAKAVAHLLTSGAQATASGAAEEGGARLYGTLLQRVRDRLGAREATPVVVEDALRDSLSAGEISVEELKAVAAVQITYNQGENVIGSITARNVFTGGSQTIYGDL
jgi:hypothetical protein